jgi:hypothetical protein
MYTYIVCQKRILYPCGGGYKQLTETRHLKLGHGLWYGVFKELKMFKLAMIGIASVNAGFLVGNVAGGGAGLSATAFVLCALLVLTER